MSQLDLHFVQTKVKDFKLSKMNPKFEGFGETRPRSEGHSLVQGLPPIKAVYTKGPESGKKKWGEQTDSFRKAVQHAQSWRKEYKKPEDIPETLIPEKYDFRNIQDYDFTGPLRDQQDCGNCNTMSFIQVIDARLKLKYGHM